MSVSETENMEQNVLGDTWRMIMDQLSWQDLMFMSTVCNDSYTVAWTIVKKNAGMNAVVTNTRDLTLQQMELAEEEDIRRIEDEYDDEYDEPAYDWDYHYDRRREAKDFEDAVYWGGVPIEGDHWGGEEW